MATLEMEFYGLENGRQLVCYEKTDRYAFMCPFTKLDENRLELKIAETLVYNIENGDTPVVAIETSTVTLVEV